mmetsp:Transcript_73584/g.172868  ORF Transcript_73584/g.172868 Transcript_73584/m.172868 type:complete len:221 (+) Transcript_73584:157-819(+)
MTTPQGLPHQHKAKIPDAHLKRWAERHILKNPKNYFKDQPELKCTRPLGCKKAPFSSVTRHRKKANSKYKGWPRSMEAKAKLYNQVERKILIGARPNARSKQAHQLRKKALRAKLVHLIHKYRPKQLKSAKTDPLKHTMGQAAEMRRMIRDLKATKFKVLKVAHKGAKLAKKLGLPPSLSKKVEKALEHPVDFSARHDYGVDAHPYDTTARPVQPKQLSA